MFNSPETVIGGVGPGDGNLVSGHGTGVGVLISEASAGTLVQGNIIGLNAAGNSVLPNRTGLFLHRATAVTVGGDPTARNVISGNTESGIDEDFEGLGGSNVIQGNFIGTDLSGALDRGNGLSGIELNQDNNTVAQNLVSGNNGAGVLLTRDGTQVFDNRIGTKADGVSALPNNSHGIHVNSSNNLIGGTFGGNTAAFNGGDGVFVESGTGNAISQNSIFANAGLGIDVAPDGVTPNDEGDGDIGPNDLQNFPLLTSVSVGGGNAVINGTLNSTPESAFKIEFFYSYGCDASGNGEGQVLFDTTFVFTDPSGNAVLDATNASFPHDVPPGQVVTATASGPPFATNTSEFSNCVAAFDDADDDNDGFTDVVESGAPLCGANTNNDSFDAGEVGGNARINDGCPALGVAEGSCADTVDDDGDGAFNDGCPQVGTFSEGQFKIGTGHLDPCGNNGWPLDLVSTGISANRFDIVDLGSFVAGAGGRKLNTNPGETGFSSR